MIKPLLTLWLLAGSLGAIAQTAKIERVEAHATKAWKCYLNISYPPDRQLRTLNPKEVEIRVGKAWKGYPDAIQTFEKSSEPMAVAIVLDASGTMKGPPLEEAKAAVNQFLTTLKSQDQAALLSFNDSVELLAPFNSPITDLQRRLGALTTGGRHSVLYKATYEALQLLDDRNLPSRRLVVVLSDGKDEGVAYSNQDVVELANKQGTPIFTLGYSRVEQVYLNNLERMAELSGGVFDSTLRPTELGKMFRRLQSHLNAQLVLTFQPPLDTSFDRIEEVSLAFRIADREILTSSEVVLPEQWNSPALKKPVQEDSGKKREEKAIEVVPPVKVTEKDPPSIVDRLMLVGIVLGAAVVLCIVLLGILHKRKKGILDQDPGYLPNGETVFHRPGAGRPSALFMVKSPYQNGAFYVESEEIWIGGNASCNLVLNDALVSNYHAVLRYANQGFVLWDYQSTNGTIIDNSKIHGESKLKSGSVIKIGETQLTFYGLKK